MKFVLFAFLCLVPFLSPAATPVETTVLSQLDKFEPFEAHLFHGGQLFVGRSRKGLAGYYRLEIYSAEGVQLSDLPLQHSPRYLYPYGPEAVLAVGVSAEPNISQYTIVHFRRGNFTTSTNPVPETAWADRFLGKPGQLIFSDPGGNQQDDAIVDNPNLPAQTLFRMQGANATFLSTRLPAPRAGTVIGNTLYLLHDKDIFGQQSNFSSVNLTTQKTERFFPSWRQRLVSLLPLDNGKIALSEQGADQVLFLDPTSKQTTVLKVEAGTPRGLATLGSCLVVASESSRQISFYDLKSSDNHLVAQWDLTGAGGKLYGIRSLAVDPQSGRVYVRSAYACSPNDPTCPSDRNNVLLVQERSGATFKQCQK